MAAPTELSSAWDRLTDDELDCIEIMAGLIQEISPPKAALPKTATAAETGHPAQPQAKPPQGPPT